MAGSFTTSSAKQERATADQTDQCAKEKTDGSSGFITLPAIVCEARGIYKAEVYNHNETNYGGNNSDEEYGNSSKD
jgi:hypothetical protein